MTAEWKWFHLTAHTFGAWLPGDPRGFRTRHHREHVEGDYKNPPPAGTYDERLQQSRDSMRFPRVKLFGDWLELVGTAVRDRLIDLGAETLAVSMSATHAHALARMPEDMARTWMGRVKLHAWHTARDHDSHTDKIWADRSHAEPIKDRKHHENTFHYILRHKDEGAWTWSFREGVPDPLPTITRVESKKEEDPPPTGGESSELVQDPPPTSGGL